MRCGNGVVSYVRSSQNYGLGEQFACFSVFFKLLFFFVLDLPLNASKYRRGVFSILQITAGILHNLFHFVFEEIE